MAISGFLSEFSLPEIFQILEQGNKTGRLTIKSHLPHSSVQNPIFHIWFKQGMIVAASDRLDGQGLLGIIQQQGWLSARAAARITDVCATNQPTGLCLKLQGVLDVQQLKTLFSYQVLNPVCKILELSNAVFQFDQKTPIPTSEMTGLTAKPKEVIFKGLRVLRNWQVLEEKLPDPTCALVSKIDAKPQLSLNPLEWQIWEFTKGTVSMTAIAQQLDVPVKKIQQAAFRLIVVGLVEEVPIILEAQDQLYELKSTMLDTEFELNKQERGTLSQSFLKSLVGFLKNKI
jgi:hypothetical protein